MKHEDFTTLLEKLGEATQAARDLQPRRELDIRSQNYTIEMVEHIAKYVYKWQANGGKTQPTDKIPPKGEKFQCKR